MKAGYMQQQQLDAMFQDYTALALVILKKETSVSKFMDLKYFYLELYLTCYSVMQ